VFHFLLPLATIGTKPAILSVPRTDFFTVFFSFPPGRFPPGFFPFLSLITCIKIRLTTPVAGPPFSRPPPLYCPFSFRQGECFYFEVRPSVHVFVFSPLYSGIPFLLPFCCSHQTGFTYTLPEDFSVTPYLSLPRIAPSKFSNHLRPVAREFSGPRFLSGRF